MNRFTADYSSSVESTPQKPNTPQTRRQLFPASGTHPSTTPLAPPPSTIFGSSQLGNATSKLHFAKDSDSDTTAPTLSSSQYRSVLGTKNGTPARPKSRPFHTSMVRSEPVVQEQDEGEVDMEDDDQELPPAPGRLESFAGSSTRQPQQEAASLLKFSTNSNRDLMLRSQSRPKRTRHIELPYKGDPNLIPGVARDLSTRRKVAPLSEPDPVILETEEVLREFEAESQTLQDNDLIDYISAVTKDLVGSWRGATKLELLQTRAGIVLPRQASGLDQVIYITSLLFTLYHHPNQTSLPKQLLTWLDNYHYSVTNFHGNVPRQSPNCTSHRNFWDAVLGLTLRGKLSEAMRLLREADFQYAETAAEDGEGQAGYRGVQLQTIQSEVLKARQVLNSCPGLQGDWDVSGPDWDVFRKETDNALQTLTDIANEHEDEDGGTFEAENFGIRRAPAFPLLKKSRTVLPRSVRQGLKDLYSILLGSGQEIMAYSSDWLEASLAMTVWWDGNQPERDVAQWSFDVSAAKHPELEPDSVNDPYLLRLRKSFLCATDSQSGRVVNSNSPFEVGLACVLQVHVQGVLSITRTLSQCLTSAIAEIGSLAGWLGSTSSAGTAGLAQEDLMVLSYAPNRSAISKDDILLEYANALSEKHELHGLESDIEGWEVAISVLLRLDDQRLSEETITHFFDNMPVDDQDQVEKVINLCSELGLTEEYRKVSERYGDHLVNTTNQYGSALLHYSSSRSTHKIRQVIDLLNSFCLVQSRAYPAEDALDSDLRALISNPKATLTKLFESDPEAAEPLQFYLAGYACLRKFYNLRDNVSSLRPLARKRAAAKSLVAAINSAADSIYGGLYDALRQSAIQVDGLLTLLGEVTVFLNDPTSDNSSTMNADQMYAVLAAIEDLQTVNKQVYDAVEECFKASLRNYHGSMPPSPHAMLKKSMSSGTGTSFSFSMVGSEMTKSAESLGGKSLGSAVLVGGDKTKDSAGVNESSEGAKRGWDWREQFKDGDVSGKDVLKVLRLRIAKGLSHVELEN